LTQAFSLDHVHKAGARFDFEKAKWFNHQYLLKVSDIELATGFKPILEQNGVNAPDEKIAKICGLVKERVNFITELWEQTSFFFVKPDNYDPEAIKKRWKPETPDLLKTILPVIENIKPFNAQNIHDILHQHIEQNQLNMGAVMVPIRLALVGATKGPDLPIIMELIGREQVVNRINTIIKKLS
jgi:glutamyl-tRNA synthetase